MRAAPALRLGDQVPGTYGGLKAWEADAPEAAFDSIGFPGAPQTAPVDGPEGPLLIVPGLESGVDALDARTGVTVWSAGDPRTVGEVESEDDGQFGMPWGGQGVIPELGLVVVTDAGWTRFYDSATGKTVSERKESEFAALSSGRRFVLVSDEDSTTMWPSSTGDPSSAGPRRAGRTSRTAARTGTAAAACLRVRPLNS